MRPLLAVTAAAIAGSSAFETRGSLQDVLVARQVLGDLARTCIVKVEFAPAHPLRAPMYAAAFSFENVFWLYSPEGGTQVLGAATSSWPDAPTLSRRLHEFDPRVEKVTVYANPVATIYKADQLYLNNACVIGSLHALAAVLHRESRVHEAGLILMSYHTGDASTAAALQVNHSLLAYRLGKQWWCVDPSKPDAPFRLEDVRVGAPLDPQLVARALQRDYPVRSVCLLPLSPQTLARIEQNLQWRTPAFTE
ncbi:MAG: hypothetical protein JWM32_3260 [Verrucomicrobia bacterium]|nr:hypothetical protein [Verrucomicrobiota bacterium]